MLTCPGCNNLVSYSSTYCWNCKKYVRVALPAETFGEAAVITVSGEERVTDLKTGGQKGIKPERFDLIPMDAMQEVARVYGYGAKKYADNNWLKGYSWSLSFGALLRHVALAMLGEDRDKETGLLHTAHAAFHCLAITTFIMRKLGTDNRVKPKEV